MAEELKNKTISKHNAGFPGYLDFTKLRSAAIRYLGQLSGKVWTDHNVHDPGITILETLIYAVLDLGYRTNLPAADLFARDPEDKSKENNFFTAPRILANNPLTIIDLRKLLVDLEGVKNAWLEIDESTHADYCADRSTPVEGFNEARVANNEDDDDPCECDFINGLYHVYVQLEDDPQNNKHRRERIIRKIRNELMAHRNLCEDFIDIQVLCKLEIGVCADIELQDDANPEEVYRRIIIALKEFFSPSPRFYTFSQLIDKGRTVDEIFAGRPYNLTESHGFVDTVEFEQLILRRVLNLSDVYHLLFALDGVKNVRNLAWRKCCEPKQTIPGWQFRLPENHIPEFSVACSGLTFSRSGLPIHTDLKKLGALAGQDLTTYTKGLYQLPSPYLEPEYPKGNYRSDLAQYYSIQNDFPRVYGIGNGALTSDVSIERKSQAKQLQGFLLFFDQLLANYLSQLKNIRSLFALSAGTDKERNHTYFINQLTDVPQFKELVRFRTEQGNIGNEGAILAYPTPKEILLEFIEKGTLSHTGPGRKCNDKWQDDFPEYGFCFAAERDQAVRQLQEDLGVDDYEPVIIANNDGCYFFYLFTSSQDFALISKGYYGNEQEARNAAVSLKYAGSFTENYRNFIIDKTSLPTEKFSFDIELNLNTYSNYLQLIAEDEGLFVNRRHSFLDHLLSRFAEKFTDYALLNSGMLLNGKLEKESIRAKERFLVSYDDISSNRGKAYDYAVDGWGNNNISGFEKRFKALAGVHNWQRHYLCNFVVEPADDQYRLSIELFDRVFTIQNKIFDRQSALASLKTVYAKLGNEPQFNVSFARHEQKWQVSIPDDAGNEYVAAKLFPEKIEAATFSQALQSALSFRPEIKKNVFVDQYIHKIYVTDLAGTRIAESKEKFTDREKAVAYATKISANLSAWLKEGKETIKHTRKNLPVKLALRSKDEETTYFLDEDAFVFRHADVHQLKETRKRFVLMNKAATIQLDSLVFRENTKEAKEEYRKALMLLHSAGNYSVEKDLDEGVFKIFIKQDDQKKAVYFQSFDTAELAGEKVKEMIAEADAHTYKVNISEPLPETWEFSYRPVDLSGEGILYHSAGSYKTEESAWKAVQELYADIPALKIKTSKNELSLVLDRPGTKIRTIAQLDKLTAETEESAKRIIEANQSSFNQVRRIKEPDFIEMLKRFRINPNENFVYKLVDKDNLIAVYPGTELIDTKAAAEAKKKELVDFSKAGYSYTDIALAGAITTERKDPGSKTIWHHYVIKCTNRFYTKGSDTGKELVLFESVKGYLAKEEAIKAFNENFPVILRYALHEKNYGNRQPISLTELFLHIDDPCRKTESLVFVPKNTSDEFNGYEVQKELSLLVKTYPLRFKGKKKVRFCLGRIVQQTPAVFVEDWRSKKTYATAKEALYAFRFFLVLLEYPGNFYIDWDEKLCRFKIYIREVLAISAHGFLTAADAWGRQGIEKFICVSQAEQGFHNYWNKFECSYGFYVACGNTGLLHPCNYETPRRRDAILDKLYQARSFHFFELVDSIQFDHLVLNNMPENSSDPVKPLVKVIMDNKNKPNWSACNWLVLFIQNVYRDESYKKVGNRWALYYKDENFSDHIIAESLRSDLNLQQWKSELLKIACYFPIVYDETTKKFYVDIRLPGFDSCETDLATGAPCGCEEKETECRISCDSAWKAECCFDTCCEALQFYACAWGLLQTHENYKPVFDCECGSYRIELHPKLSEEGKKQLTGDSQKLLEIVRRVCSQRTTGNTFLLPCTDKADGCLSEIVAINPQSYINEKMACDAVSRAKKLINSEGLHLVEHILLRPRCKNADGRYVECDCDGLPVPCEPTENELNRICHFRWTPGGEPDPCEDEKMICFTPGCDPYSFIATVALPAWPSRFRSEAGRKVVEKMLQREAPAHVLLRVLWLSPRDFCCFEHYYKIWGEWLAKKLCDKQYTNCEFLRFLFNKQFDPLEECSDCQPCKPTVTKGGSCFEQEPIPCIEFSLPQQLNDLFCWGKGGVGFNYTHCEPCSKKDEEGPVTVTASSTAIKKLRPAQPARPAETAVTVTTPSRTGTIKEKSLLIRSRSNAYNQNLLRVAIDHPDNELVQKATMFLKSTNADARKYNDLVNEILEDNPGRKMDNAARQALIKNITWKYLDLICFNGKDIAKILSLENKFNELRQYGIDMNELYEGWEGEKVKEVESLPDFERIRTALTGS